MRPRRSAHIDRLKTRPPTAPIRGSVMPGGSSFWTERLRSVSFEQGSVGADPSKLDGAAWPIRGVDAINQKEVTADMAFPVGRRWAFERVIPSFGTARRIVGDGKQHHRLQAIHVVSARTRDSLPVLEELPAVVSPRGQLGPPIGRWLLQVPQTCRPRWRIAPCGPLPFRRLRPSPHEFARWAP